MRINIEQIAGQICISPNVYINNKIRECLNNNEEITLDFTGVEFCNKDFLNLTIGIFFEEYEQDITDNLIIFQSTNHIIAKSIEQLKEYYYKTSSDNLRFLEEQDL